MKIISMLLIAGLSLVNQATPQLYVCKNVNISMYSKAPIEDIEARSAKGTSVYNAATGELAFKLPIISLKFEKSLMEEHFNDNYMESEKYPLATFNGKIQQNIDVSKDGTYPVTAVGVLNVHGVAQNRTIPGTITVQNGVISMTSEFMVKCVDHQIAIPKLVFHNIAESIRINVSAKYDAYKK